MYLNLYAHGGVLLTPEMLVLWDIFKEKVRIRSKYHG